MYSTSSTIVDVAERVAHCRHGLSDASAWPDERTDIESDAQWVHGHAEASRWRTRRLRQSRRLPCPAFPASTA